MKDEQSRVQEFLDGLEDLTKKTGILVHGCGCCGSPSLHRLDEDEKSVHAGYAVDFPECGDLGWLSPDKKGHEASFPFSGTKDGVLYSQAINAVIGTWGGD